MMVSIFFRFFRAPKMYRGLMPRCIFFCPFLEKTCEKIHFQRYFRRRLFVTPHASNKSGFYYERLRICTRLTGCKRCDKSGGANSRPQGQIFRDEYAPGCPHEVREFPHETASVHRGDTEERSGGVCLCCARWACRLWKLDMPPRGVHGALWEVRRARGS